VKPPYALAAAVLITIALVFGYYGYRIAHVPEAASKVQSHLDAANEKITALEKRVKDLEDARVLDEQRIAQLEAKSP
jgi:predicted  nucleic acid-binding Zn-ribbon protein